MVVVGGGGGAYVVGVVDVVLCGGGGCGGVNGGVIREESAGTPLCSCPPASVASGWSPDVPWPPTREPQTS